MKLALVALIGTLIIIPTKIWSQQISETIEVTGSRIAKVNDASFSEITREQIEQINPVSTIDLLRRIPHIAIAENGPGGVSFVSLRGGESNFTLVLIDGVTVNDSSNSRGGGFDFNQISPDAINKIEVYRGGISAIYGGEAISGVIHIITRASTSKPTNKTITFEIGGQSQINASATLQHHYKNGINILASLSSRQEKRSLDAERKNQQALLKFSLDKNTHLHQMIVNLSNTENIGFAEDSGGELYALPKLAENRDSQQSIVGLTSQFTLNEHLNVNTKLSWLNRIEDSVHPGIADGILSGIPASRIESEFDRKEAELFTEYSIYSNIQLITGISHRRIEGANDGELDFGFPLPVDYRLKQTINSVFAELQYAHTKYAISAGWRYDGTDSTNVESNSNAKSRSETSLRVATNYYVNNAISIFAVYNEGYKLPSFFALAHPLVGNPNLLPERSKNIELGINYQVNAQNFSFSYFNNHFTDLVDFDANLFTNVNRNSVRAKGLEFGFTKPLGNILTIASDVTYNDISVDNGPSQLRRRPKWLGSASIVANFENVDVTVFTDITSSYLDSSIPTGLVELGGYSTYGLAVNWWLDAHRQVTLNAQNIFAKEYQESVGFVNDNMNVTVGFRYLF